MRMATEWSSPKESLWACNIHKHLQKGSTWAHNTQLQLCVCMCVLVCVQTFVNCAPFDPGRRGEEERASQEVVSGVVIIVVARVPLCYQLAAIDAVKRQPIAD